MRRIKLVLAVGALIALLSAMAASPAVADNGIDFSIGGNDGRFFHHNNDDFRFLGLDNDVSFLGLPFLGLGAFDDIDVDTENVPNNSSLAGDCLRTEFDEVTCFV